MPEQREGTEQLPTNEGARLSDAALAAFNQAAGIYLRYRNANPDMPIEELFALFTCEDREQHIRFLWQAFRWLPAMKARKAELESLATEWWPAAESEEQYETWLWVRYGPPGLQEYRRLCGAIPILEANIKALGLSDE